MCSTHDHDRAEPVHCQVSVALLQEESKFDSLTRTLSSNPHPHLNFSLEIKSHRLRGFKFMTTHNKCSTVRCSRAPKYHIINIRNSDSYIAKCTAMQCQALAMKNLTKEVLAHFNNENTAPGPECSAANTHSPPNLQRRRGRGWWPSGRGAPQ